MLGCLAAGADDDKKASAQGIKNLILRDMNRVLHKSGSRLAEDGMRRILVCFLVLLAWLGAVQAVRAGGQGYPEGGQMPGGRSGRSQPGSTQPGAESPQQSTEKPDAAAKKAFNAGLKSLNRAREFEEVVAKATNPDKKAVAMDKVGDAYGRALDQFTEALRNKGDMVDAWNYAGYVHLRLGAYNESIDDFNHALALKPDLLEAIEHRGEACMAVDRLDAAKAAYMDLFNHARPLADQLMVSMQKWLEFHRAAANGMRAADIDSFGKWLQERDDIAKQTASASASIPQ
jgi:tetratricopeptide (TPR) repeat protein